MRIDNGKEFINEELKKWAAERGITLETTAPYSPSQNGVAERFNRTLLELARAMIIAKNLPIFLWDEAVSHANYLRNRSSTVALKDMTPQEAYTNKKPDVSHLREFGCDVWVLDESGTRSKLDPKSKKMIFVGFMDGPKAIGIMMLKTGQLRFPGTLHLMRMRSRGSWRLERYRVYKLRGRRKWKISSQFKTNLLLLYRLRNHRNDNYETLHSWTIQK